MVFPVPGTVPGGRAVSVSANLRRHRAAFDLRFSILCTISHKILFYDVFTGFVGMHRHTFTGRPAFTGQPRSKTPPDFMSCFALHVAECEPNGKRRFRRKLPDGIPHARQIHERPQTAARTIYRRMARTLRTMASGKRTGDKQRRVPHALPAAVYNKAADRGSFIASRGNPFYRRHIRQVATRKRARRAKRSGGSATPTCQNCIRNMRWRATSSCSASTPAACRSWT